MSNLYRNRVKEYRTVSSKDLQRNSLNFRRHPERQKEALRELLRGVGRVAPLLAYEHDGALQLLDGHARLDESDTWDVAILDIDDSEAATVLAMLDKIGAGAEIDTDALMALLDSLNSHARQTAAAAWSDDELARIVAEQQPMPTIDELWKGMPEFEQEDKEAWKSINVLFVNEKDYQSFAQLIAQPLTEQTKAIWYPKLSNASYIVNECADES